MSLVLYASNVSPPSRAVMMLIEILQIKAHFKEISLPSRDHYKPEYLAKNPLHTIPTLEDEGFIVVDSNPIMTYLVSKNSDGNSDLYPTELRARSLVDQRLYFDATILFPRLRSVIYSIAYGKTGLTEQQSKDIDEAYGFLENYLEKSGYVAGDNLTIADLSCVATVSSLDYIVPVSEKYKNIKIWWNKIKEESWYKQKNLPGAKLFGTFMGGLLRRG